MPCMAALPLFPLFLSLLLKVYPASLCELPWVALQTSVSDTAEARPHLPAPSPLSACPTAAAAAGPCPPCFPPAPATSAASWRTR